MTTPTKIIFNGITGEHEEVPLEGVELAEWEASNTPEKLAERFANEVADYRHSLEKTIKTYEHLSSFCDAESVAGLTECFEHLSANGGIGEVRWDGANSSEMANIGQIQNMRSIISAYRQKTRLAGGYVINKNIITPYEGDSWKSDFDAFMENDDV